VIKLNFFPKSTQVILFICHEFQLKEVVAEKFGATLEQVCLIFAGKILKDQETLAMHNLKDGLTVHLVIKSSNRVSQDAPNNSSPSVAASQSTPAAPTNRSTESGPPPLGLGGLGGLAGYNALYEIYLNT